MHSSCISSVCPFKTKSVKAIRFVDFSDAIPNPGIIVLFCLFFARSFLAMLQISLLIIALVVVFFASDSFALTRPNRFLGHIHRRFAPQLTVCSNQKGELRRSANDVVLKAVGQFEGFVNAPERRERLRGIVQQLKQIYFGFVQNSREKDHGTRGGKLMAAAAVLTSFVAGGVPPVLSYLIGFAGLPTCLAGCYIVLASVWQLKEMNSLYLNPCEGNRLITHGMYEHVRHPMYGGLIMASAGLSVASQSVEKLVITAALAYVLDIAAAREEKLLEAAHPQVYEPYASGRKRFIPYFI